MMCFNKKTKHLSIILLQDFIGSDNWYLYILFK